MQISSLHIGSELMSFAIPPMEVNDDTLISTNESLTKKKKAASIHLRNAFFLLTFKLYLDFFRGAEVLN